jgi:very-short-patch-repair endonuclease
MRDKLSNAAGNVMETRATKRTDAQAPPPPDATAPAAMPNSMPGGPASEELRIEPAIVRWLSLAALHNGLPVIRGLGLKWQAERSLENLQLTVRSEPQFTQPSDAFIERIEPGASYRAAALQVQPQLQFFAELAQVQMGNLRLEASSAGKVLAEHTVPVRLLPVDFWLGVQDMPELLAAYIQPDHPVVARILGRAAQLLKRTGQDGFSGYRRQTREAVGKQIAAIYASFREEHLAYVNPPASFETSGQRVRLPDQIESEKRATCLDLVLLFAAALEHVGLHPLVLFKKDHAWLGCWLDEAPSLSSPFDEDGHTLRKRHAVGEIHVLELTCVCQASVLAAQAARAGAEHLAAEAEFVGVLDVHVARRTGIRPLPVRVAGRFVLPAAAPAGADALPMPPQPQPSPLVLPLQESGVQRLERWKRKLLDLSLRNRLINFKPTSKTLRVLGKQLAVLEDVLAEGRAFAFDINPRFDLQRDATSAAPIPAELAQQRIEAHVTASRERGKLVLIEDDKHKVESRLVELLRMARTAEEEGGVSPLFLALGMLEWKDSEAATAVNRAPIMLMPVALERSSVRAGLSGLKLTSRDEDTRINPTLLEKLRRDFGVVLEIPESGAAEGKSVDVDRVLAAFRHAAVTRPGWDVKEEVWLGEFSFRKFVMWRDLQECEGAYKTHPLLRQMLEQPHTPLAQAGTFPEPRELDNMLAPDVVYTPLLADSSQLAAIQAATQGRSFVLEGPPGTGKSQTITNLIAHNLAQGKTVLFVSEKRAALEVVRKRLHDLQLGPYCLEVHSDKARKSEIIAQLRAPLAATPTNVDLQWAQVCGALGRTRRTLNQYAQALHESFPCGLSIFDCTSWLSTHPNAPFVRLPWGGARDWNRPVLAEMRSAVAVITPLLKELGNPGAHALVGTSVDEWSPAVEREVTTALERVRTSALELQEASEIFGGRLTLSVTDFDDSELEELFALAEAFLEFRSLPAALGAAIGDAEALEALTSTAALLQQHLDARNSLFASYKESFLSCNAVKLERWRQQHDKTWWPRSRWMRNGLRKTLKKHIRERILFDTVILDTADDLQRLRIVQTIGTLLAPGDGKMRVLLGKAWQQQATDPALLLQCIEWLQRIAAIVRRLGRGNVARVTQLMAATKTLMTGAQRELADGELRKQIDRLLTGRNGISDAIGAMSACLKPAPAPPGSRGLGACNSLGDLVGWVQRAQQSVAADHLRYWAAWRRAREAVAVMELQPLIDYVEQGKADSQLLELFESSVRRWLLEEGLTQSTALRNFIGPSHDHLIEQFRKLDAEYVTTAGKAAASQVDRRLPRQATPDVPSAEFGLLNREINKKSRHRPLRQLFGGMPSLLRRLKPCFLMSPLSVAQHLDPSFPPFDLVVFDEASQIPVWDALSAIVRARQVIIVGDPKQMPPTAFFNRVDDDQELEDVAEDLESILDESLTTLPVLRLNWHYRSRYESLITFSNRRYYDGQLVTFPSPAPQDNAVQLHRVYGVYGRAAARTNPLEAEAVVGFVLKHLRSDLAAQQSIGIVTFNIQQQRFIEDLLDKARGEDAALDAHFLKQPGREEVFVKNLENVQGDERDLIVFSTTFGVDEAGKVSLNFGPLNGANGPRRLNVAVTRARQAIHVFSSLWPDALDVSRTSSRGVQHLKEFLEYAERGGPSTHLTLHDGPEAAKSAANQHALEQSIAAALRLKGWEVHQQIGSGGYKLDLAVVAPHTPERYLLAIECDGLNYNQGATARDRDRLRQIKLEELGWQLHRVWSTDWWRRPAEVVTAIDTKLKALAEASKPAPAPPVE